MSNKREDYLKEFEEILAEIGEPVYNADIHIASFDRMNNGNSKIVRLSTDDVMRKTIDSYLRKFAEENKVIYRLTDGKYALVCWQGIDVFNKQPVKIQKEDEIFESKTEIQIKAFGLEWDKSTFIENGTSIVGKLKNVKNSDDLYFNDYAGIYVLYKNGKIVYVGKASCIRTRLYHHLRVDDDLYNKWDSFSWFALYNEFATLDEKVEHKKRDVINSFEALLIDVIKPIHNWKRGDNHLQKEYEQVKLNK